MFITLLGENGWAVTASDRAHTITEGRQVCTELGDGNLLQVIEATAAQQGVSWDRSSTFVSVSIANSAVPRQITAN
jgi:Protein of unknown function (DUF732)